jgi:gas vesicle structural protein
VRVSLVGIELLTIDARIVVASVDTYLRFAEATNRLDLEKVGAPTIFEKMEDVVEGVSAHVVEGKVEGVKDKVKDTVRSVEGAVEDVVDSVVDHLGGDDDEG